MNYDTIMVLGIDTPTEIAVGLWIEAKIEEILEQETIEGKAGHVYFLQNNEYVKIGCSAQIDERIAQLERELPGAKLLGYFPSNNMFATERLLHEYFKHKHYRKEWYELSENDIANVDSFAHRSERDWTELLTAKGNAQIKILKDLDEFITAIHCEREGISTEKTLKK